jgi:diguanylate cyclase (GGDEF)-like protein
VRREDGDAEADAGRSLRLVTTGVVAVGVLVVVAALGLFDGDLAGTPVWLFPVLVCLVALASAAVVQVRIRSTTAGSTWTDAATLVAIVVLPRAWVPLCVFAGVLVAKLIVGLAPMRAAYNASKDALAATVGLLLAIALGVAGTRSPLGVTFEILVVALGITAAEYTVGVPVMALASGTRWTRLLRANLDIKVFSFLGKYTTAVFTLGLWQADPRLLGASLPVALCLHVMYSGRVRARAERAAWQRLAATTEELNDTDLEAVLGAAVVNAARLFAAHEAEVFLSGGPDGPVLVRGDGGGVSWSGEPGLAPPRRHDGQAVTVRLVGRDPRSDLGELRLHYRGRVSLTDRERLTLRTFVSALRTAVRTALAYAEARRLAEDHAHTFSHDQLTGLPNRRRLREHGEALLREPGLIALVVVDIDHFREVNETLGHLAGDRLLVEVGRRLSTAVRRGDPDDPGGPADLVARLGGDEFAVLLSGVASVGAAQQRARELLATLDVPVDLDGMRVRVEASAGVAVLEASAAPDPEPGAAAARWVVELLRRADVAMYQAKRGGARVATFEADKDTADVAVLTLGGELPRAVANREFVVNFQPVVDLATGVMISAEALARWHHPRWGDLNPRQFLVAVERSGLLPAFVEAVLDQAIEAMLRWRALGLDATVAVNVSPRNLLDPGFARMVVGRLEAYGVRGADVIMELTETLTLAQVEVVGDVLRQLRDAGLRFALDDFGTGHSSLALLAKVPVHELKIDQSFVAAMGTGPEAATVIRSTVDLGNGLGLLTVAEGVERPDQRLALWQMGCQAAQGHLFARAMPVEALLDAIQARPGGVLGRFADPVRASGENVIDLPRARRTPPPSAVDG